MTLTCPLCPTTFERPTAIAGLIICPACFRTLTDTNPPRVATGEQTTALDPETVKALRQLRRHAINAAMPT